MNKKDKKLLLNRTKTYEKSVNVIHIGLGSFYRAFACDYFQKMNLKNEGSVRVMGVSLRNPKVIRALERQNGLFTAFEKGSDQLSSQIFDSICDLAYAPDDPLVLLEALARPSVALVTLTITEKGYCLIPSTGTLDLSNSEIIYDLKHPDTPRTAIGFLVYGLYLRKKRGLLPFTCLSCDNLSRNGKVLSRAVLDFAQMIDIELVNWISSFGAFPSSMVDRIVPSISMDEMEVLTSLSPYLDFAPVVHEPYSFWVIENNFTENAKFNFEEVGIKMVSDVEAFECVKLRCLNGSHSALAYLGYISGFKTIFDAISDPILAKFLNRLWEQEIIPTVVPPSSFDLSQYIKNLITRYKNPNIQHLTKQISMDGSQKIPQRILGTIEDNLRFDGNINLLCEVIAAWIRFTNGIDEFGNKFTVSDPKAEEFLKINASAKNSVDLIQMYLNINDIFSLNLKENKLFRVKLESALIRQNKVGTIGSLEEALR